MSIPVIGSGIYPGSMGNLAFRRWQSPLVTTMMIGILINKGLGVRADIHFVGGLRKYLSAYSFGAMSFSTNKFDWAILCRRDYVHLLWR